MLSPIDPGAGLPTVPPLPQMTGTQAAAPVWAPEQQLQQPLQGPPAEMALITQSPGPSTLPTQQQQHQGMVISADDLVTPRDMTGVRSPSAAQFAGTAVASRPPLSSPQRLAVTGDLGHVNIQGVRPYIHKSPWDAPPAHRSPGKQRAMPVSATKGMSAGNLSVYQHWLASQLAGLDVALAGQVTVEADRLRLRRVRQRVEHDLKSRLMQSMADAVSLISRCRGIDPYTSTEAEALIRERTGRTTEHPLHRYGFLFHIVLYPVTILLAIAGYVAIALAALASVGVEIKSTGGLPLLRKVCVALQRFLLILSTFIMVLPISVVCVAFSALPDILLLLVRPILPSQMKLKLSQWFFPTSLAFWTSAKMCCCGFSAAFASNLLLGACPLTEAFVSTSLGGQLCDAQSDTLPVSAGFQAAVVCAPHFMAHHKSLRSMALRGVPEYYAPAGGSLAQMPFLVQWAYLLGDSHICAAWEAESMGYLPPEGGLPVVQKGVFMK